MSLDRLAAYLPKQTSHFFVIASPESAICMKYRNITQIGMITKSPLVGHQRHVNPLICLGGGSTYGLTLICPLHMKQVDITISKNQALQILYLGYSV